MAMDNNTGSRRLSDEELTAYTVADPFAQTTTQPWEMELKSSFLRKVAIIAVCIVIPVHIFMGAVLDIEYTGATVTAIDKWSFPILGVIISVLVWILLTRPRLRANADGVEIRNMIGTRFYPWVVIYGLSFPEGSRMARLELPEFEYVPIWAMQSGDKATIVDSVQRFRELEAQYMPED